MTSCTDSVEPDHMHTTEHSQYAIWSVWGISMDFLMFSNIKRFPKPAIMHLQNPDFPVQYFHIVEQPFKVILISD